MTTIITYVKMNILIIEDDRFLAERIRGVFEKKVITNRIKILHSFAEFCNEIPILYSYNIILTDLNLGSNMKQNGIEIIKKVRNITVNIPIVVISCHCEITWLEQAFEHGANDYIVKPFRLQELELRVLKWFKIYYTSIDFSNNNTVIYKGLSYNLDKNNFFYNDIQLLLTKKSKFILSIFLSKPEILISEREFIEKIWGDRESIIDRNLRVNILRLKKELNSVCIENWIKNVRGEGYILEADYEFAIS